MNLFDILIHFEQSRSNWKEFKNLDGVRRRAMYKIWQDSSGFGTFVLRPTRVQPLGGYINAIQDPPGG